jgi:hypothetical protein
MAQSGGLISKRTALEYLKPVFGFNDIDEELKAIKADAEEAEASAAEGMEGGEEGMMGGEEGMPPEEMPQEGYPLEEGAYPPDPAQPYAPEGYPPEAYPPEEAPFPQEGLPPQEAAPPLEEAPPVEENATFSYPEEEQPPIPPEEEEGTGKMIDISLPEIRLKKIKEGAISKPSRLVRNTVQFLLESVKRVPEKRLPRLKRFTLWMSL